MTKNQTIRPARRNGNVVTVLGDSGPSAVLTFCNDKGAAHYMMERARAAKDPSYALKTRTFEAKPEKAATR